LPSGSPGLAKRTDEFPKLSSREILADQVISVPLGPIIRFYPWHSFDEDTFKVGQLAEEAVIRCCDLYITVNEHVL